MSDVICIDIGGTAIKYGLINDRQEFIFQKILDSKASEGGPALIEQIVSLIDCLQNQYEIRGVSISTPGVVDAAKGEILICGPNIPDYSGTPLKAILEERLHLCVEVENDVNCAALAEAKCGAAKGFSHAFVMTIGTGIGGCFVVDGKVLSGASGAACEVGFMPFEDSFFEFKGSASALCRHVQEQKPESSGVWTGKRILEEAARHDLVCCQEIDRTCCILGKGLSVIASILNPDVIVLGGGIMKASDVLIPKIQYELKERMMEYSYRSLTIKPALFENNAGMLGAYLNFQARHPSH